MQKDSTKYIFIFALIICLICSFLLTFVSQSLKTKKELNVALDMKKNILKAVALESPLGAKAKADEILSVYKKKINEIVIDLDGNVVSGTTPDKIIEGEGLMPLYIYQEGDSIKSYAFPIVGQGLWSTLYGYLAIESDAMTVRGITFYKHGETPGLGAEIEKDWFQNNFKGKKVWNIQNQKLHPVAVIKGKVDTVIAQESQKKYYVDGISGATITSKGVTEMIDRELRKYEAYFSKVRK